MRAMQLAFWCLLCTCLTTAQAGDWLRFRGPDGSGASDSQLPVSWTPSAGVAWKTPLPGPGVSSPIVVGDRVFVTCYTGYGVGPGDPGDIDDLKRHLVCVDATSGDIRWQRAVDAAQPEDPYAGVGIPSHGYASHTPVSDGQRVYAYFGKSGAVAFDLEGKQLWQTSVGMESDPWKWGSSCSPIVYDDLLIVTAAAESQAIVALDAATGEEVWRQEAEGLDGMWGTPVLVTVNDDRTDLVMSVPGEIWGLDPATGKLRWHCHATDAEYAMASPVVVGDVVYAFTGRGGGAVAVRAGGEGDVTDSHVLWTGRTTARFGSPVAYDGKLYLAGGDVLSVVDAATGKRIKQVRLQGGATGSGRGRFGNLDYASPVVAGERLYYVNGKGETFVFNLHPELEQISVNLVTTERESFGGTPAIADGRMFLRSDKRLYCVTDAGAAVEPNASRKLIAEAKPADSGDAAATEGNAGRRGGGRDRFDPAAIFNRADADKDGKLTAEEVADSPWADRFAEVDQDGDGGVTLEEFRTGMRQLFGNRNRGGGDGAGRGSFGPNRDDDDRPERPRRPEAA